MSWLYATPIVVLVPVVALLVVGALELGHRISRVVPVTEKQLSAVSGPLLAVVGLLLAFSFSMAQARHAARRTTAVEETNAIGTVWLRTSLLADPIKSEMRSRLRRYVDVHFEHRGAGIDVARLKQLEDEAARLQRELWALLMQEALREPEASKIRLLVPALNAMIDDGASALAAKENRLPDAILFYLFVLVGIAGVVIGYRPPDEKRHWILWGTVIVVLGGVLLILLDMDRPRRGLILSDPTPYIRLKESLRDD